MSGRYPGPVLGLFAAIILLPSAAVAGGPYIAASLVMPKVEVDVVPDRSFEGSRGALHGGYRFGNHLAPPWDWEEPLSRDKTSGTVGVFGAGLGWLPGQRPVSLRLLVDWHDGAGSKARTFWIGANYHFSR